MPEFTVAEVVTAARGKLSDNASVSAGRIVTDTEMLQFTQLALLELRQILRIVDTPFTKRELYVLITPNTRHFPLYTADYLSGIAQIGEIFERKVDSFVYLTTATLVGTSNLTFATTADHNLLVGDMFEISGSAFPWLDGGYVAAIVPSTTTVTVGPRRILGTVGATGGVLIKGSGAWSPVSLVDNLIPLDAPVETIAAVTVGDFGLNYNPILGNRELKIEAYIGAEAIPALTDKIVIADSLDYLAGKCALQAHLSKGGNAERISALRRELYGASEDPANIEGGSAGLLRRSFILQSQWKRRVRRRFRDVKMPNYPAFVRF